MHQSGTQAFLIEVGERFCFAFTFFSAWEAVFSLHAAESFRTHVGDLAVRAIFFAVFTGAGRWWFVRRRASSVPPTPAA